MGSRAQKLVVGVGGVLYRDDGVGVRVAEAFSRLDLPDDVEVYDAGTVGLDAAPMLEDRELVVVVDAIDAGAGSDAGSIYRLTPERLRPFVRTGLSLHDVHLLDALDEVRLLGRGPGRVVVYAVQVGDMSVGVGLSVEVAAVLDRLIELVGGELGLTPARIASASSQMSSWDT